MKDSIFLDTNVVVYCYSATEKDKQQVAVRLANSPQAFVSTQVVQELSNTLFKKFKCTWPEILSAIEEVSNSMTICVNVLSTIQDACRIAQRHQFSFYDSLIVASALQCGCGTLYTEDLQHGLVIDGKLTIVNPFLS